MSDSEISKRKDLAFAAIQATLASEDDEGSVSLFVQHHLSELPNSYWMQHLGTSEPEPLAVVGLLRFECNWGENDIEYFDFTLPDEITNYLISVHFDEAGEIDEISMES